MVSFRSTFCPDLVVVVLSAHGLFASRRIGVVFGSSGFCSEGLIVVTALLIPWLCFMGLGCVF